MNYVSPSPANSIIPFYSLIGLSAYIWIYVGICLETSFMKYVSKNPSYTIYSCCLAKYLFWLLKGKSNAISLFSRPNNTFPSLQYLSLIRLLKP